MGWEGTTSADGSPLIGFGEGDDLQRDMEEFSRFAQSLPSPIPPLSARSQVNGGGWTSLPPDLKGIAAPLPLSALPSPANSPLVQSSPSVDTRASRRREASNGSRSSEGRSPSIPRPSLRSNSANSSPSQFFDTSSSLHPPAMTTNRSPLAADESDAYLSESGVEDFLSDDDDGVGGESYSRHYLPFAAGLGISGVPGDSFIGSAPAGGSRDWDEEEVLDATSEKAGVVDWSGCAIERMAVPTGE